MAPTALFLDAAYLERLCQDLLAEQSGGRKVPFPLDYKRFPAYLAQGTRPAKIFYYHCPPFRSDPPLAAEQAAYEAKARFTDFLGRLKGWELREGVLERRGRPGIEGILVQKRVDVMLAVDLTRLAWRKDISRAIVVAGDSDFVPAIADARAAGVHVTLWYGPGTAHPDLVAAASEARPLTREGLASLRLSGV